MAAAAATAVQTLLVEDDPDTAEAVCRALRRHGFDVEWCRTAGAALVELETGHRPAAAIIDLGLPDATGALVLWRIRRDFGDEVPVAVVSGRPDAQSRSEYARAAPDVVFPKPADLRALVAWVKSVT